MFAFSVAFCRGKRQIITFLIWLQLGQGSSLKGLGDLHSLAMKNCVQIHYFAETVKFLHTMFNLHLWVSG